jgi:hypothetical protein
MVKTLDSTVYVDTDPVTTIILDFNKLTVTVIVPKFQDYHSVVSSSRKMMVEDLDPSKWTVRASMCPGRERFETQQQRIRTLLTIDSIN